MNSSDKNKSVIFTFLYFDWRMHIYVIKYLKMANLNLPVTQLNLKLKIYLILKTIRLYGTRF